MTGYYNKSGKVYYNLAYTVRLIKIVCDYTSCLKRPDLMLTHC